MIWAIVDEYGIVVESGEAPNRARLPKGSIKIDKAAIPNKSYIENGKCIDIDDRPGDHYIFDRKSKQWIKDNLLLEKLIREKRNYLISETDWTQLPDISSDVRKKWAAYRKELRDLTNQAGFPESVVWPDKPL